MKIAPDKALPRPNGLLYIDDVVADRCAGHHAQGPSRLAVAVTSVLAPTFASHAVTVPGTGHSYAGWDDRTVVLVTSKLLSLSTFAPSQHHAQVGQEHGRTIP
jgi:hypothetical protein